MPILLEEFAQQLWAGDAQIHLPGTRKSAPLSLQALLKFNGITINDHKVIDHFRVTSVDGFHGTEIRHSEEPNPSDHGMTPLDNWLGGKTLIVSGIIKAGNIDKLSDMEEGLRTALYTMTEKQFVVSVSDFARDVYINARPSDKLSIIEQQTNDRYEREFQFTLRASDPRWRSIMSTTHSVLFGYEDGFSTDSVAAGSWQRLSGNAPTISGGTLTPDISTYNSLRLAALGYQPTDSRQTIKITTPATMSANDIVALYKQIDLANHVGGRLIMSDTTNARIQTFARVANSDTMLSQTGTFALAASTSYWLRVKIVGNVLTAELFTSDPSVGSPAPTQTSTTTLTSTNATSFGAGRKLDVGIRTRRTASAWVLDDYKLEPMSLDHKVFVPRNLGNFLAQTKIRLWGPMTNVVIRNATVMRDENAARQIKIQGEIPADAIYEYDAKTGSVVDQDGNEKTNHLSISSKNILLENGDNPISITAENLSGTTPRFDLTYAHTWI